MQAIILAAGNGSRLRPITNNIPKVMVKVCGKTIIERSLDCLSEIKKIKEVIIVVGYKAEKIKEYIGKSYKDMKIKYVLSKDYASTNNIYSLWLARDHINSDVILIEGDILFDKEMLEPLLNSTHPNLALVAKYNKSIPGTVVTMDKDTSKVKSFIVSKDQEEEENYFIDKYKTINIYLFKKHFFNKTFMIQLEIYMNSHGKNVYYEAALGALTRFGDGIYAHLIENIRWYEVDNNTDLKKASLMFSK